MIKKAVSNLKKSFTRKPSSKGKKVMGERDINISSVKEGMILRVKKLVVPGYKTSAHITFTDQKFKGHTIACVHKTPNISRGYYSLGYSVNGQVDALVHVPLDFVLELPTEQELRDYQEELLKSAEKNLQLYLKHSMTTGSDPEVFAQKGDGSLLPAFTFLPGKDKKLDTGGGGWSKVYWDGFQAEFGVNSGYCLDGVRDQIQRGLQCVYEEARKVDAAATLSIKTTVDISEELLKSSKDEHVDFGCTPSLNAYGMTGRKMDGRDVNFRPAGGHIHFGFTGNDDSRRMERCVKAMDAILGVACVALYAKYDDPRRRMLYGLAGEYRLPKHGLEYRVLSNAWLMHPTLFYLTFDVARKAFVVGDKNFLHLWKATEAETIDCINNCDVKAAQKILKRNKEMFCKILQSIYAFEPKNIEALFNMFLDGCDSGLDGVTDIVHNWRLADRGTLFNSISQVAYLIAAISGKRKKAA